MRHTTHLRGFVCRSFLDAALVNVFRVFDSFRYRFGLAENRQQRVPGLRGLGLINGTMAFKLGLGDSSLAHSGHLLALLVGI